MTTTKNLTRGLRPLLLLALAAGTLALPTPEILHREVEADGLHLTVDVTQSFGARRQTMLMVTFENRRPDALALSGGEKEYGLHFHLVDAAGRTVLDGEPHGFTEEVRMLAPGARLRWTIDLTRRPLVRLEPGPWQEVTRFQGLADGEMGLQAHVDLVVEQATLAGESLRAAPIRIQLNPDFLDSQTLSKVRAFSALHRGADRETAPTRTPGTTRLLQEPAVPGELLVSFAAGVSRADARRLVEARGLRVKSDNLFQAHLRILVVTVPEGQEADVSVLLRALPEVTTVEPNGLVHIF